MHASLLLQSSKPNLKQTVILTSIHHLQRSPSMAASTLTSIPTTLTPSSFHGLRPLKPTDSSHSLLLKLTTSSSSKLHSKTTPRSTIKPVIRSELNPSLVISLSTGLSLFLGRFVFFNFQRENVAKQGLPEQNGKTHFESGDVLAKEYVGILKSNDPVGFNIVDVLAWGSIGHIVAYYILATSNNGYDPSFFG